MDEGRKRMPNGGSDNCGNCSHFHSATSNCELRQFKIYDIHWTTCRNFADDGTEIKGPLFAIVFEVRNGAMHYDRIPYFDGIRVDTIQRSYFGQTAAGDTYLEFINQDGTHHQFETVAEYYAFYEKSGRSLL
jgi:hypothetical protein